MKTTAALLFFPALGCFLSGVSAAVCPESPAELAAHHEAFVVSPLDGVTVHTNELWSCATNLFPGAVGFFRLGTRFDGDEDGLSDTFELLSFGTSTNAWDTDGDGLTNWWEFVVGTDWSDPDTDGDGVSDGAEWFGGSNPLLSSDTLNTEAGDLRVDGDLRSNKEVGK